MAKVKILLTFDDGPHDLPGAGNGTRTILQALKVNGIIAAFYIQTGVAYRMASAEGKKVVREANGVSPNYEHVIEIHSAGKVDHEKHWVNPDRLSQDLPNAVTAIEKVTNRRPKTIRAVGLELANPKKTEKVRNATEKRLLEIYAASQLKHMGINVDSYDNTRAYWVKGSRLARKPNPNEVREALRKGIAFALKSGPQDLVVLFHDLNMTTRSNIGVYIVEIRTAVMDAGHTPSFTASRSEVESFLSPPKVDDNAAWELDKPRPEK
jgi:peptidoglycan/xylan/chitin deacetylase (PgdA/CDA1 family)